MARQLSGAELIAKERQRQIEKEGWTVEHDSDRYHTDCEIAQAAACYIYNYIGNTRQCAAYFLNHANDFWPWDEKWFKPTPDDPIRELTKAGALIAAEIDRLQRIDQNKLKNLIKWKLE